MFALNGIEIAHLVLAVVGIGLILVGLGKGADLRLGLVAMIVAMVIPVFGPVFAVLYGATSIVRNRRTRGGSAHPA